MSKPYPMVPGLLGEDVPLIPDPSTEPDTRKVFLVRIFEERSQKMYVLCNDAQEARKIAEEEADSFDFEVDDTYYSESEVDNQTLARIPGEELVTAEGENITVGEWLEGAKEA